MPVYKAPVDEMLFLLNDVFHIERYANLPGFSEATPDVVNAADNFTVPPVVSVCVL